MSQQNKYNLKNKKQSFINDKNADNISAFLLSPSFEIENNLIKEGYKIIAGIDEAGRGSLAGPLAVGLTIYSSKFINNPSTEILNCINDSKKLNSKKRELALELINKYSMNSYVSYASHKIIDKININRATEYSILKLLDKIPEKPDILILDGNFSFNLGVPVISVKSGDSKSISIASASIVAKVKRDQIMEKLNCIYPEYGFKYNKGYGTKHHIEKIKNTGISFIHRKSYEPARTLLSGQAEFFKK